METETILPNKYKNHYLKGDLQGFQECHIEKDLILMYKIDLYNKKLILLRIGTHKDLLNK